ncbi:Sec-independent protein translocase [gamma proteobacterium HdN1]|nr:Sec-independent protein translocase [gamma proteobacterium HdN1]
MNQDSSGARDEQDTPMPLIEHLIELRRRLLVSVCAILVCFLALIYFANDIYLIVSQPIRDKLPAGTSMIATDITATFFAPFKLTAVVALFLAMPVVLHQFWKFVSPGLYQHERRVAIPILVSSVLLFYIGIAFAHYVIFPLIMAFFVSTGPESIVVTPDISQYLSIALSLFFAFGATFEIPVAIVLMVWSGVTTRAQLADKRRYIIVLCFFVGMLLTPPDPFSQTLLAVPMILLFEFGLQLARLVEKLPEAPSTELVSSSGSSEKAPAESAPTHSESR